MKKVLKTLKKVFKSIYKVIDKIIITPISRLVYHITEYFKKNNNIIEKFLNRPTVLIYVSLLFALAIFFLVDSKVISFVETNAEIIAGQPVTAIYNEEAYVVEGIPSLVDITLMGRKTDLYLAKQLGEHEVVLDLSGYGVGEHKVRLTYKQNIDSITYKLDPSTVLVILKEKISTLKDITNDLLNQDKLDPKLSVKSITLDRNEVVVKGSKDALDKVANVKALIDLNNDDLVTIGEFTIENIPLVAYDENGEVLTDVEIVPQTVKATITLDSYSKEVPIKVVTSGDITVGYALSSMTPSIGKVTIYGEEEALNQISYIPVEIDITNLKSNKTYNVTISKPTGVRFISETKATVAVTVDSEATKEITSVTIESRNVTEGLSAGAKSISDATITVTVKGVSSVLESIDQASIHAYVDLSGYERGTHSVPVVVECDDARVQVVSNVNAIDIVISNTKK